jgi:hypothetical protein
VIVDGRVVYGRAGWVRAQYDDTRCALCGEPIAAGADIIRVSAHVRGGNWAGRCCEVAAVFRSGNPTLIAHLEAKGITEPGVEDRASRAAALYRAANACSDADLKTAIELRQLAGRIERGEA